MKVAVIGCGVVGGALVDWFRADTDHEIAIQDPPRGMNDSLRNINAAFLCVPAATRDNRTQDLSVIETWVEHLAFYGVPIFIRSTVLPGTCDRLSEKYTADVFALPEFLTERFAKEDVERHPIVCGGRNSGVDSLPELLLHLFPGKAIHHMTNIEAEIAKYTHNCFGAMKVNYFNIVAELCGKMRANYRRVLEAARITGFIEAQHTKVPGPDGKFGFGGHCLPKDLKAFVGMLYEHEIIGADTLASTERDNHFFRDRTEYGGHLPSKNNQVEIGIAAAKIEGRPLARD